MASDRYRACKPARGSVAKSVPAYDRGASLLPWRAAISLVAYRHASECIVIRIIPCGKVGEMSVGQLVAGRRKLAGAGIADVAQHIKAACHQ